MYLCGCLPAQCVEHGWNLRIALLLHSQHSSVLNSTSPSRAIDILTPVNRLRFN